MFVSREMKTGSLSQKGLPERKVSQVKNLILIALIALGLLAGPTSWDQGRNSGKGGQGQGGMSGMQRRQDQPPDVGAQNGNQQRLRMHSTQQQRDQNRTCSQSVDRVRTRLRDMSRLSQGKNMDSAQLRPMNQQLSNELQLIEQERERLAASLDEEQSAAAQNRLQQMSHNQQELQDFSEALDFELNQETVNNVKFREQVKKMNSVAEKLQNQQRDLSGELAID